MCVRADGSVRACIDMCDKMANSALLGLPSPVCVHVRRVYVYVYTCAHMCTAEPCVDMSRDHNFSLSASIRDGMSVCVQM